MEKYPCGCAVMAGADRTNNLVECPVCHRMWSAAFNRNGWLECTPDREKEELHTRIAELESERNDLEREVLVLRQQRLQATSMPCPHCICKESCRGWAGAIADAAEPCDCNTCDTCLDRYREE